MNSSSAVMTGDGGGTTAKGEPGRSTPKRRLLRVLVWAAAVVLTLSAVGGAWWYFSRPEPRTVRFQAGTPGPFSYGPYGSVLRDYVNDEGMVDYKALKAERKRLDDFAADLGKLDPKVYDAWTDPEKIAFWINAYNALTLELIIEHYPIRRSAQPEALVMPANSIMQIPGRWTAFRFLVMGRQMTLDEIEHATLRKHFDEPRIHMALVCAAVGCPPLRTEPYEGDRLDEQLDEQAGRFLADPKKFRIDPEREIVHLSSIFKWFGEDFIEKYGADAGFAGRAPAFAGRAPAEGAVLNFVSNYLPEADQEYLRANEYSIDYLAYDWSLNGQPRR